MIAVPIVVLAAAIGVVLAALESPHGPDNARAERLSGFVVAAGAATVTIVGALVARGLLPD